MKAASKIGIFEIACEHGHKVDEEISLLLKQSSGAEGIEIQVKVADVIFKRDGFEIKCENGLVFHTKNAPKIGETIRVKIEAECLG